MSNRDSARYRQGELIGRLIGTVMGVCFLGVVCLYMLFGTRDPHWSLSMDSMKMEKYLKDHHCSVPKEE